MKETSCTQSSAAGNSRGSSGCSWGPAPCLSPSRMHPRELSALVEGRAAAVGGLLPAAQCFGPELTDSVSAHSPLAETLGVRKGTSIVCPESQGPGVLGGPQRDYAQVAMGFTAAVLTCALEQPGAQRVVLGAVGSGCAFPLGDPVSRVQ